MMQLFKELQQVEDGMDGLIDNQSVTQLNRLDQRYEMLWDEILSIEPENDDMAELMLLMLLDKMETMAERGEVCAKVREKILALFQSSQDTNPKTNKRATLLKLVPGIA